MSDQNTEPQLNSEAWPKGSRWDKGPWYGKRAQLAVFLASLAVAAGGGWLGYSHGRNVDESLRADGPAEATQAAPESDEFGIVADTAIGAAVFFFGSEVVLNFGLVSLQRRHQLNHPESSANANDTPA